MFETLILINVTLYATYTDRTSSRVFQHYLCIPGVRLLASSISIDLWTVRYFVYPHSVHVELICSRRLIIRLTSWARLISPTCTAPWCRGSLTAKPSITGHLINKNFHVLHVDRCPRISFAITSFRYRIGSLSRSIRSFDEICRRRVVRNIQVYRWTSGYYYYYYIDNLLILYYSYLRGIVYVPILCLNFHCPLW